MTEDAVLVTGAAGFIGLHVAQRLLQQGHAVVGLDNMNAYYDPALKEARIAVLQEPRQVRIRKARYCRSRRHARRCSGGTGSPA